MAKKEYIKPEMELVRIQQSQIICASITTVSTTGLDSEDDLEYDDAGGNQGSAW